MLLVARLHRPLYSTSHVSRSFSPLSFYRSIPPLRIHHPPCRWKHRHSAPDTNTMSQNITLTFIGTTSGGGPTQSRNCSSLVVDALGNGSLWSTFPSPLAHLARLNPPRATFE